MASAPARKLRADAAQAVGAEHASEHKRLVGEGPGVRVLRVLPAEGGEILAGLKLQVGGSEVELQE